MFVEVTGKKLHYEKNGTGNPLILLHGNGENLGIFREAVSLLSDYFTVYAVDMPGHGSSYVPKELHYVNIAEDIYGFIKELNILKPVVYGFSDGGIVGLIIAVKYPDLLSKLVVSGVNINPKGLRVLFAVSARVRYFFTKSEKYRLMLEEPNLTAEELAKISVPTFVTAGQLDCIKTSHTKYIAAHIRNCSLKIFKGEFHGSYVMHSQKIAKYLICVLLNR